MTELIDSFERLLDPITPETFFAEVHHKKALHIAGRPDKFASVMSWDILIKTVPTMSASRSLVLNLDCNAVRGTIGIILGAV